MRRLLRRHYGTEETLPIPAPTAIKDALDAYFEGDFDALAVIVCQTNGSPFQRQVWAALCEIPPGKTMSYAALAASTGKPAAVRAVGLAHVSTPIGIVVPRHRVIGANGKLCGHRRRAAPEACLPGHDGARRQAHIAHAGE